MDQAARLQKRLEAIPKQVREAAKPAVLRSAEELAALIEHLAPKDTGALRDSIAITRAGQNTPPYSQPGGRGAVPEGAVAITAGNTDVRYAHLVEHGTGEAGAQPFFWPAVRLLRKRITSRIKRAIGKAVRENRNA